MTTVLPEADGIGASAPSSVERIRDAALKSFATYGTSATSLRTVAAAAGVSLGLVQHHFATKAGLIKAVDDHVLGVVTATMSQPIPRPPADSLTAMSNRVTSIMVEHPDVLDYLGRALIEGSPLGTEVFDFLVATGIDRWKKRAEQGQARPDIDLEWAVLNALVLPLGTLILRSHVERHLLEPLTTPTQLDRWQDAVNMLLREGLFRPSDR